MGKVRLTGAVADANVAALAQYAMALPRDSGRVVVERGLSEGERIVTSGTFLVDSESRLRAALEGSGGGGHGGHRH